MYRVRRIIGAGTGDHRHPFLNPVNRKFDRFFMLGVVHRRRLAGRPRDDNGVGAVRDLIVDQAPKLGEIYTIRGKRRNDRDAGSTKNNLLHENLLSFSGCR